MRYQAGLGDKILFWHDVWAGDTTLAVQYPNLYSCARDQMAKVGDYMEVKEF